MNSIYPTIFETLRAAANYFVEKATEAIAARGRFNVALSGGSSPRGLYELLASEEFRSKVDWHKTYFFFGDERYVPSNDPDYNGRMVGEAMFSPLGISDSHVFLVDTSLDPEEAATKYARAINSHFGTQPHSFDLILLGLGDNSHTASLFPFTDVLAATDSTVRSVFLPDQKVFRITMTAPLINEAHHIAFLVFGASKAEAVKHVQEDEENVPEYPAQLINPVHGDMVWFMDEPAAHLLGR